MTSAEPDSSIAPGVSFADVPAQDQAGAVAELGLQTRHEGDTLVGRAVATPEMWVPGTEVVRTSVLACWADAVTGLLAGLTVRPTITVTLDLEIDLYRPLTGLGEVRIDALVVKHGRQVTINRFHVTRLGDAQPVATGVASFMASPNPDHVLPEGGFPIGPDGPPRRLTEPFADRARVSRIAAGVAEVPWQPGNLNATGSINGGLIALVAEEAVLSAAGPHMALISLSVRYLRPFRDGSAHATADVRDGLAIVDVMSTSTGKPGAAATARVASITSDACR